jgi:hypothetical protein
MTSGFESVTFWLVASTSLATACPLKFIVCVKIVTMSLKQGEGNNYIFSTKGKQWYVKHNYLLLFINNFCHATCFDLIYRSYEVETCSLTEIINK